YKEYEIDMKKGDKLFLYTDGIPEAVDIGNRQFGIDRLVQSLNEVKGSDVEDILKHVKSSVSKYVGEAEQFDDLTMLCLEYNGTQES
ncbi:MAG: serine/threonine-protein phosphatase, partial [Erysipelotrichaceae bacterium]|nr:serine/threonine-protein phosphatase [Erysipelotrichaceae bacterium]